MTPAPYDDEGKDRTGPLCAHWDDLGCGIACARCGCACPDHEDRGCGEWLEPGSPASYWLDTDCPLCDWEDQANAFGFSVGFWLRRMYERSERFHEASVRTSPFLTMFRG